jgi:hypothetical protein
MAAWCRWAPRETCWTGLTGTGLAIDSAVSLDSGRKLSR